MKNFTRFLFAIALAGLFLGCAGKRSGSPFQIRYFEHQVAYQGETLALISRWYTGRSDNWQVILDHNPQINAYRIRPGDIIRIPESLVSKTDPLPQAYVARAYQAKVPDSQANAETSSASGTLAQPAQETQTAASKLDQLGPPEKTLPEAGLTAAPEGTDGGDAKGRSRDELLNELLTE